MLKFLVFSDSHYKKGMYRTQVEDLEQILRRAHEEQVDFVVHAGDFSNDYQGSPEFLNAYLHNQWDLPVYGVYGNHETEFDNPMSFISAHLSNREVNFGPAPAGTEVAGHWYTDIREYRLIGLDTNYSYNSTIGAKRWEHNTSYCPPKGNMVGDSLSPAQLSWLYDILAEAHQLGKKVIVVSHAGFSKISFSCSPDAEHVQAVFSKFPGTVLMAMNGHYHTDHLEVQNGVCYFDVNAAINGSWSLQTKPHYADTDTFSFTDYDADGNRLSTRPFALNDLAQGSNTWSFKSPLSAVVTIDGKKITVKGSRTEWDYGVAPTENIERTLNGGIKPEIPDRVVEL
jgi:hypothetical protein